MSDELRLNNNLIGYDGIIGRYNYFYNKALILFISSLVLLPFAIWMLAKADIISNSVCIGKLLLNNPFILIFTLLALSFLAFLDVQNSIRRTNDILAKVNKQATIAILVFIVISYFGFLFVPFDLAVELFYLKLIFDLIMLCKQGVITSKYPYDVTKQFNWGAFLGTWIWGLFNKSYITLWQILLFFTPLALPFALICGIKGNEWAYKNKKWEDDNKFNKSQEKQAGIFTIIFIVLFPIFNIVFGFGLVGLTTNDVDGFENKMNAFIERTYIDSYEIKENENIFYIKADLWKNASYKERYDTMKAFASLAADKREKEAKLKNPDKRQYYYRSKEIERTKIYSSEKHELLAEFKEPLNVNRENYSIKDAFNEVVNGFKFYEPSK